MIKAGSLIYGVKPELVMCHIIANQVFESSGYGCVITSGVGKEHKAYSLHPVGYALDYRTKHIKTLQEKETLLERLKIALPVCDFLLEHVDKPQEHIHMEYDDKNDKRFQADKQSYRQTGQWPKR